MSTLIKIVDIPIEMRKIMINELNIKEIQNEKRNKKYTKSTNFNVYDITDDKVTVPFAYYFQQMDTGYPNKDISYPSFNAEFCIELFDRQKEIKNEALYILNKTRSIVLSLYTGYGKTLFAIYLACKIKLKTVILCHRIILIQQWYSSIIKACGDNVKIQILSSVSPIDVDADFYIVNVVCVTKRNKYDLAHCGLAILDEVHLLCTEKFSQSLTYIFPKYLIGLSATPVRSDGKDRVIELFCGPHIIYKPLKSTFNVYLLNTQFVPKVEKSEAGDMLWNSVLESQCLSKERNELIINITRYFAHRSILILCKRKDQVNIIQKGLLKYKIDSDTYMGSQKIINYTCRVLISTYSKGGCGMDCPRLDMLIVASDAEENWIQFLGRVFRREHHIPLIVDFIDKFRPLKKHTDTRIKIYKESGGEVKNLLDNFKDFDIWKNIFSTNLKDIYQELGYCNT